MKTPETPVTFVSIQKNADPNAPFNEKFPKSVSIPTIARIYDPEKDMERLIQYTKGQSTIFLDEMKGEPKPAPSTEPIQMRDGYIMCNPKEKTLIEYLKKSYLVGNKNLLEGNPIYDLQNYEVSIPKELNKIYEDVQLITDIKNMSPMELAGLSLVLGDKNAHTSDVSTNRWNLTALARKEPAKIRTALADKKVNHRATLMMAQKENVIIIDDTAKLLKWGTGEKIANVPIGLDGLTYFIDLTFQPEYEEVYKVIRQKLGIETIPTPTVAEVTAAPLEYPEDPTRDFVDTCKEKGILKHKGIWWSLEGSKQNDKYNNFVQGSKVKMVEYLEKNPDFKEFLEAKLKELELV